MTNPRLSWLKSLKAKSADYSTTKPRDIPRGLKAFFVSNKQQVLAATFIAIAFAAVIALVSFGGNGPEEVTSRRVPLEELEEYANADWRREGDVGGEADEASEIDGQDGAGEGAGDTNSNGNSNVDDSSGDSANANSEETDQSDDDVDNYKTDIATLKKYATAKIRKQIEQEYTEEEYLGVVKEQISGLEYSDIFSQSYITPEEGGVLEAGNYKVVFPAGAVSEVVIATIRVNATTKESITEGTLDKRYSLTATNVYGEEITQFGKDLEITVELKSSDTASGNSGEAAIYYLNEDTNSWDKLASNVVTEAGYTSVTTNTNHFSEYMAAAEEPTDPEEEEYPYEYCRLAVDDYNESTEEKDRSECFAAGGLWQLHSAGHNDTSLYAPNFVMSEALWIPDFKSLTEEKELFVTIPGLPQNDDPEQEQYELTENVTYLVLHAEGVEEVLINQSEEFGNGLVSLGSYNFAGDEAAVFIYNSSPNYVEPTYFMADLVCFGEEACEGVNLDFTPPTIEDVSSFAHNGKFRIEATITDDMSGVASAFVYLNGQLYPMSAEGDIYGAEVPHSKGVELDYYILAYDGSGNEAIWSPTRGYITRGTFGSSLGIPPWAFYMGKNKVGNAIPSANPGSRPCSQFCGDPINTSNGNLYDEMELLQIAGRPEIELNINYNSQGAGLSIFGENWNHSYNYHLTYMDNSVFSGALVQYPDGRQVMFEGEALVPESGNFETLEKTGDGFRLTYKDQTEVYFDEEGDIERWEDENDNGLNFVTGENLEGVNLTPIHSIAADGGRSVSFNYSEAGLVSQIDAPGGTTLRFEYDENDDLVSYTDADGGEYTFEYANHDIIKKVSPKGHAIYENTFDDIHRVTRQVAGDGFVQEYSYGESESDSQSGFQAIVKDGRGTVATYNYTADGTLDSLLDETGKTTKHEYDDKKQVTKTTDAGGKVTNYEYDENGNVTRQTDALGKSIEREYHDEFSKPTYEKFKEDGKETHFEYDDKGNLTKATNALGDESKFVYDDHGQLKLSQDFNGNRTLYFYTDEGDLERTVDAKGKATSYEYDNLGRKVKETDKNGNTYRFEYDSNSNLTKVAGPKGYILSYEYDDNNHLVKEIDANGGEKSYVYSADENLVKVTDQLGNETSFEYGEMNELLKERDAEGRETLYGYSERYELTDIIQAAGSANEAKTTFGYDARRQQTEVTDAEGRIGKQEYDPLYRLSKKIEDATGISAETTYTYSDSGVMTGEVDANGNATTYKYDLLDRVAETTDAEGNVSKSEYDANGNVTKRTNARGHETTFSYDPLNRIIRIRDAKGGETYYEYDANSNLISERDPKERFTIYKYDELNRLTEEIVNFREGEGSDSETNVTTSYVYDLHGNMTMLTNARGKETSFSYDAAHRNTKITDAHGEESNYIYDKVGNFLKVTDRNGNATATSFDELNRVVQTISAENQKTTFGYDRVGNRVKQIDARGGNYTSSYDGLNRMIKTTDPLGGSSTYGYDNVGNLTAQADENGHTTNYSYDAIYRTTGVTNPEGHSQAISYDKNGNVIKASDANGNETKYAYDELDRLTEVVDALEGESTTSYDSVGNVVSETDENGHTTTYTFDKQYRVTKVTDAEGHETEFSYDATGNRLRVLDGNQNPTNYIYDDLDRLTEIVNAENEKNRFGYDNEGNKTAEIAPDGIVKASSYDRVYRLVTVIENFKDGEGESEDRNIDTNYGYDANNNLVSMQNANDNATRFEYDPLDRQIKEIDAEGNAWSFGYDPASNRTVRVDANGHTTNYNYYADDQLETVSYYDQSQINYSYDPNNNAVEMQDSIGQTNWNYDALDRVTAVDDALSQVLEHSYDPVDNRTGLSYQDGKQQSFSYYKNNWLESMTDPEGGVVSYERDGVGNTVKINNPNLTVSYLNYDKVYRTREITNYSGKDVNSKFSYDYNSAGFRKQIEADYAWRKPAKVTTNYEYDGLRRLTGSSDSEGIVSSYGYDRVGNRLRYATNDVGTSSRPFDAFEQDSSYNKINQVQQILESGKGGKGKGKSQHANVSQALYALEHELVAQRGKHITEEAATTLLEQTQVLIAQLEASTLTTEEIQSELDSLKAAIEATRDSEGIDSDGVETSLLAKIQRAGDFNVDTSKGKASVKELQAKVFSYDANGNRINKEYPGPQGPQIQGENYTYDPEDRLASVENYQGREATQGNSSVNSPANKPEADPDTAPEAKTILRHITVEKYDGKGRRLIKEYDNKVGGGGNKIQHYTYDNLDPVSVKQTWNGQHSNLYRVREAGQSRIAMAQNFSGGESDGTEGPNNNGSSYWYHYDALGSVAGLTKQNGQSDHNYRYDDFGQITPQSGASGNTSGGNFTAPHNSFTYTGQEFDEHTNLYEFYNRAYDPEVGVWLQQDDYRGELPQPMSQHRYMYVNNSPANYWDEYGYNPGMGAPYMEAMQKHYEQEKKQGVNSGISIDLEIIASITFDIGEEGLSSLTESGMISTSTPDIKLTYGGRTLTVINTNKWLTKTSKGITLIAFLLDSYEVISSNNIPREATAKVVGWGGAWAGAKVGCVCGGATVAAFTGGSGAPAGCAVGGTMGGVGGYFVGEEAGYWLYDRVYIPVSNRTEEEAEELATKYRYEEKRWICWKLGMNGSSCY